MIPDHMLNHVNVLILSGLCFLFFPWYLFPFVLLLSMRSYASTIDYLRNNQNFMNKYNIYYSKLQFLYSSFKRRISQ